jgi:hypothetical protein
MKRRQRTTVVIVNQDRTRDQINLQVHADGQQCLNVHQKTPGQWFMQASLASNQAGLTARSNCLIECFLRLFDWMPPAAALAPFPAVSSTAAPADPSPAGQVKKATTVNAGMCTDSKHFFTAELRN